MISKEQINNITIHQRNKMLMLITLKNIVGPCVLWLKLIIINKITVIILRRTLNHLPLQVNSPKRQNIKQFK